MIILPTASSIHSFIFCAASRRACGCAAANPSWRWRGTSWTGHNPVAVRRYENKHSCAHLPLWKMFKSSINLNIRYILMVSERKPELQEKTKRSEEACKLQTIVVWCQVAPSPCFRNKNTRANHMRFLPLFWLFSTAPSGCFPAKNRVRHEDKDVEG